MSVITNPMEKFNFLLGKWQMQYRVPKSSFGDEDFGEGDGEFKRVLNNRYVTFDYHAKLSKDEASAHAIFTWDESVKIYRFWWFEDSGAFMQATCNFIDEKTLCLNWHNSLLVQTFSLVENDKIILEMRHPSTKTDYEIILEVTFSKKKHIAK